ncbi:hypothetical protein [Brevibacillus porteri]|uniref:hypothetical protein n=1 Tax=Brevibacillus porteri TaxID=2126350 RepID=UPI0036389EB7
MYKINAYFESGAQFGYVRVPGSIVHALFDTDFQANEYAKTISVPPGVSLQIESVE